MGIVFFVHFQEKSQLAQIFDPVELNLKIFEEDQLIGDEMNFIDCTEFLYSGHFQLQLLILLKITGLCLLITTSTCLLVDVASFYHLYF